MRKPTKSFLKVPYDLRPSKQVERRIILDTLLKLSQSNFNIGDYQYTGMGSIHFVDFLMFHKILGIKKMWSIEHSLEIQNRIKFNKPFEFIRIIFGEVSDAIPRLSRDIKHILWLDYDDIVSREMVGDLVLASTQLSSGSILLVTVDVEPPGSEDEGPREWMEYFRNIASEYVRYLPLSDFGKTNLPRINAGIIERAISQGLVGRDVGFHPLFSFLYADGHQMLTIGGVIGGDAEKRSIDASGLGEERYIRRKLALKPFEIKIPVLTRKERLYLDAAMPCQDSWNPKQFELSKSTIHAYRDIYRFIPSYAELLL
jgi:hypothetical protein